jgi:hypothetical protein
VKCQYIPSYTYSETNKINYFIKNKKTDKFMLKNDAYSFKYHCGSNNVNEYTKTEPIPQKNLHEVLKRMMSCLPHKIIKSYKGKIVYCNFFLLINEVGHIIDFINNYKKFTNIFSIRTRYIDEQTCKLNIDCNCYNFDIEYICSNKDLKLVILNLISHQLL